MKKIIVSSVLILGLVATSAASAHWNRGNGGGYNTNCFNYGKQGTSQQFSAEDRKKHLAFQKKTTDLRKQLAVKKAEERAMLNSDTPDSTAVARLSGEIFDLQNSLKSKADAAGIDSNFRGGRCGPKMIGGGNRGG